VADRALATIETIRGIVEHPDADLLEICFVRGWRCVVRKADGFKPGQQVLYLEVDSHLDVTDERFAFLAKGGVKTNAAGWKGHRLRTVKLRGMVSQGLIMPLDDFPELREHVAAGEKDVTPYLPVRLWDPVIPHNAEAIGPFPNGIPKTDEERVQNLSQEELAAALSYPHLEIREKLDGQSVTAWVKDDGTLGVAGRNWELSPDSTAYRTVAASPAGEWLKGQSTGMFVQGELCGPNIQGNPLKLVKPRWFVFTVGVTSVWAYSYCADPAAMLPDEVFLHEMVPPIPPGLIHRESTVEELVAFADGINSMIDPTLPAEGVVVRGYDESGALRSSFKSINNQYLLKEK
jgi:RNA ligase (TIGR02306 family)